MENSGSFYKMNILDYNFYKKQFTFDIRMSYEDFLDVWDQLYICHMSAENFLDEIIKQNQVKKY